MSTIKTVIIYTFYKVCVGSVTKNFACGLTSRSPYATLAKLASDGCIARRDRNHRRDRLHMTYRSRDNTP